MTDKRDLSPDARLALVQELERREADTTRSAIRAAWLSLVVVAVLIGALVFVAWLQLRGMRSEVATLAQQKSTLDEATKLQKAQLERLDAEIKQKKAAMSTLIGAVRTDPLTLSGVGTALDRNPSAVTLVPRAYVQILDEGDRQWARNLSDRFQDAGVIPVGIEHVRLSAPLKQFEVRYYKKAEEEGASRIVRIMKDAGVPAELKYLNLETSSRVRANHFEVWCPANARANKLRPR